MAAAAAGLLAAVLGPIDDGVLLDRLVRAEHDQRSVPIARAPRAGRDAIRRPSSGTTDRPVDPP